MKPEVKHEKEGHTIYGIPADTLKEGRSKEKLKKYGPIPCPEVEVTVYKNNKRPVMIRQPEIQDAWLILSREQWTALKKLIP